MSCSVSVVSSEGECVVEVASDWGVGRAYEQSFAVDEQGIETSRLPSISVFQPPAGCEFWEDLLDTALEDRERRLEDAFDKDWKEDRGRRED